jgi:hypothetical protein
MIVCIIPTSALWKAVNKCGGLHVPSFQWFINYVISLFREVFKAKDKKTNKKFVAMKKVLMDNEKEGVSGRLQ